ncbi:MAG: NAD-dependent DNA ligase LigA, partial [Bacteroidota bacterium]
MASNPYKKSPFPDFEKLKSLSKKQAKKEVLQLRDAINYHDHRYYIKNDPIISDKAYDTLLHRLEEIENNYPDLKTDTSPTQKVGAPPVDKLKKKEHKAIMLSLNSSDEEKKIREFIDSVKKLTGLKKPELVLEPKLDGLSVEVYYEKGRFSYAATRGDGKTGEDISENVKTISSLPLQLRNNDYPDSIAFRGEIFMPLDAFRKINKEKIEKNEDPFANARNAAAGIVRQLDSKKVAKMPLDIFFYEVLTSNEDGFKSHYEMLKKLPEWGLKTNSIIEKCESFKKIKSYYSDLSKKRDELSFEIDGIVIKLNDRELRKKAGVRERSPRWAYAWKFKPKKEKTILRDIVIQVGRTGKLTPVALFDPVDVGGVTVSR